MFEDYEECFGYLPEADLIIEEAKKKLFDLLSDEVKRNLDSVIKESKRYDELRDKCRSEEARLARIENSILKAEKELEESELYKMPLKYATRFVRNAIGDFTIGDEVYTFGYVRKEELCPMCKGNGKIEAIIGEEKSEIKCPKCGNTKIITVDNKVIKKAKVSDVYLRLCFHKDRTSYWNLENIYLDNNQFATNKNHIFATYEEAEQALKGGAV